MPAVATCGGYLRGRDFGERCPNFLEGLQADVTTSAAGQT